MRLMYRGTCVAILLAFYTLQAYGQRVGFDFKFEKLPQEIGFFNTGVNDILEDHRGFLWMATWSGLAKYDGYSVKMYRQQPGNTNGLKSNKITQLFEDSKGNLWIGTTYTGFYRYDRAQDSFIQYCRNPEDMNSLSNDNVWAIHEDREGQLWIGTERGLNRFNPNTGNFVHYENSPTDSRSLSHNFIYSIGQTNDGSLWIGTEEGLNRLIRKGKEEYFIRYELAPEGIPQDEYLPHNFIYKIVPSGYDPHTLWLCTSIGLKKFSFSTTDFNYYDFRFYGHNSNAPQGLSHPFISDVLEHGPNRVWVATYNGLNLLNSKAGVGQRFTSNINDLYSLNNNLVKSLSKDRTGNLWIGMDKGVNKLDLNINAFHSIHLDATDNTKNSVHCILPASSSNKIWTGTRGGGVSLMSIHENGSIAYPVKNYRFEGLKMPELGSFIIDLLLDQKGQLWVATDGAGLIRADEQKMLSEAPLVQHYHQYTKQNHLSDDYIMSLMQSSSGYIWLGYWDKGLDRYDPSTGIFHHYIVPKDHSVNFQEFPVVHFEETIEEEQEFLWVGTRGGGVYKLLFDPLSNNLILKEHYVADNNEPGSLSNNSVNAFMIDRQGRLWIGTDSGLNVLDNNSGKFTSFYEHDGLKNAIIQSIIEDGAGNIWVSTQQGVSYLDFSGEKVSVKNFDAFDGLQDNFFNDDAAAVSSDGHLIFGGINGLSLFQPDDIKPDTIPPKIAITDFRLFNRSVPIGELENGRVVLSKSITETQQLELTHRDNVISFEYTGMHFGEPKKIQYAYQLEGFDSDWVYTDASQRLAHYTNLPYEKFTFKVKAANGDGYWSEPVELELFIQPPFWLTGWAYAIYALIIAGLIYLGLRITKLRAEFRHSLELERVEREKLEEVNRLKLQFFTNISHELRTPLTLIISPLEQLLQNPKERKLHQLFTRMHYNAKRLLTMINQLLDIRKSEAGLMKLHVSEGDIVEFCKEITASFRNLAKQRDIKLHFSAQQECITAWFDHDQLEKVLFNLLSNAFKFTKDGGEVSVSIRNSEPIEILVSDTGVGIPKGQLESIFERFYQVENSKEWARKSGTGIGLSLAKMIIEKHHGKIKVESREGEGTTFFISLQTGKGHFSEADLLPAQEATPGLPEFTLPEPPSEIPQVAEVVAGSLENGSADRPLILIVDDNPDIRAYLRENLEPEFRISEAGDGKEGLEKALDEPPALIVADIAMPRMDGIELCGKVKSNINTSHVPVILLTARTSLVFRVDGLETGADDYVTKPFHMRLLAARIRNLINNRKMLQEHFAKNYDLSPSEIQLNSLDEQLLAQIKLVVERHIDDSDFFSRCACNDTQYEPHATLP